ncbi:MAG TPA: glyoxalase, partial [Ruminococcaceae bacterium]|nr:glyoxalase [Oscillospiraceae bacterium]
MDNELKIKMYSFTLDCKAPRELAKFYSKLLGWTVVPVQDEDYVIIAPPGTNHGAYPGITFQRNPDYKSPVWPDEPDAQQQMAHLDFAVADLEKAEAHAVKCGAVKSPQQFSQHWTVMKDPEGHPFCLCLM